MDKVREEPELASFTMKALRQEFLVSFLLFIFLIVAGYLWLIGYDGGRQLAVILGVAAVISLVQIELEYENQAADFFGVFNALGAVALLTWAVFTLAG